MSNDSSFTGITGDEKPSEETGESDDLLGLKLLKAFLLLNRKDKLEVIHFVSQLASSRRGGDT
jgi:hypothetical protein